MKKTKKFLSVLMTLCMMLTMLPITAQAGVPPLTVGTGGGYSTLTAALAAAEMATR